MESVNALYHDATEITDHSTFLNNLPGIHPEYFLGVPAPQVSTTASFSLAMAMTLTSQWTIGLCATRGGLVFFKLKSVLHFAPVIILYMQIGARADTFASNAPATRQAFVALTSHTM